MTAHEEQDKRSAQALMDRVNAEIAAKRRTLRVVENPRFAEAYNSACTPCRNQADELVKSNDQAGLESWVRHQKKETDCSGMTIRQLREVGRKLGVPNYNRISKAMLLSEVARYGKTAGPTDESSGSEYFGPAQTPGGVPGAYSPGRDPGVGIQCPNPEARKNDSGGD